MKTITSGDNKLVKEIIKLKKGTNRKVADVFLIDGEREIRMAIQEKIKIKEIFYCPEFAKTKEQKIAKEFLSQNITMVSKEVFNKISYKENPDGFLALADKYKFELDDIKLKKPALIIILEAIEKPGNLGAIIRTAVAAGADLIICTETKIDFFNPNVIRASEGLLFAIPLVNSNNLDVYNWLKQRNINSLATSTQAISNYLDVDLTDSLALILGAEDQGLQDFWLKKANKKVKIMMNKKMDSLNLSVSAAIVIFEALRQRRNQKC